MITDAPKQMLDIPVEVGDAVPYGHALLIGPAGDVLAVFHAMDPPQSRTVVVQAGAPTADPAFKRALAAFKQRHQCDAIEEAPCTL